MSRLQKGVSGKYRFCPECGKELAASAPENVDGEAAFTQAVLRFAEAFTALSDEEKEQLKEYAESRCAAAEEEYNKSRNKNKK